VAHIEDASNQFDRLKRHSLIQSLTLPAKKSKNSGARGQSGEVFYEDHPNTDFVAHNEQGTSNDRV